MEESNGTVADGSRSDSGEARVEAKPVEEAIDDLLKEEIDADRNRAKYRLHVIMGPAKGYWKGFLTLTTNAMDFFEGRSSTESSLMWCTKCECPTQPEHIMSEVGFCATCNAVLPRDVFCDGIFFNFSTPTPVAERICELVRKMELDVDILLVRAKQPYLKAARELKEQLRFTCRYDRLNAAAHEAQEAVVYPRDRLMSDVHAGKDLVKCLKAFLSA